MKIERPTWQIEPCERMLFVGSCFADNIGRRFAEEQFHTTINPFGVMYNPASMWHTISRWANAQSHPLDNARLCQCGNFQPPRIAVLTLGTNRIYRLKATGEIVDNCEKRPQSLFQEEELGIDDCFSYLSQSVEQLLALHPSTKVVVTVSPIRYAKYGFHGSALSKAVLLLAADRLTKAYPDTVAYFPAYEIVNDELRDYRFYKADMLHPSEQAVEYIWQLFSDAFFSNAAKRFLQEWHPLKQALHHQPFHPDSEEYRNFMDKTMLKVRELSKKYPNFPGISLP